MTYVTLCANIRFLSNEDKAVGISEFSFLLHDCFETPFGKIYILLDWDVAAKKMRMKC